jgi:hypothetical protein
MKFQAFREFRESGSPKENIKDVVQYIKDGLPSFLKDWATGFSHLTFDDNFQGFVYEIGSNAFGNPEFIGAGDEIAIPNKLRPVIPSMRIIFRGNEFASYVQDSDESVWSQEYLYLKNYGTGNAELKILFLK